MRRRTWFSGRGALASLLLSGGVIGSTGVAREESVLIADQCEGEGGCEEGRRRIASNNSSTVEKGPLNSNNIKIKGQRWRQCTSAVGRVGVWR